MKTYAILAQADDIDNKVNNGTFPLETCRQWIVVVLCVLLMILFAVSIKRLYKTHHHFTFDCIILSAEAFKVYLISCYSI